MSLRQAVNQESVFGIARKWRIARLPVGFLAHTQVRRLALIGEKVHAPAALVPSSMQASGLRIKSLPSVFDSCGGPLNR
jgi:hypothetical protein